MSSSSHNFRLDDALWALVTAKAEQEGRSVTDVVRQLLSAWIAPPAPDWEPKPTDPYVRIGLRRPARR